mmetsp:Transcript_58740/g.128957  ORF Transcript_58740/g.128957 Transcript_58740/m.128957 type:complete len:380 (+) Transcript_58740:196-1335(+)
MLAEKRRFLQLFLGRRTLTAGDSVFLGCVLFCLALLVASLVVQFSHEANPDASQAPSTLDYPASPAIAASTQISNQQPSPLPSVHTAAAGVVSFEGKGRAALPKSKIGEVGHFSSVHHPGFKTGAQHWAARQQHHLGHPQHHPPQHHHGPPHGSGPGHVDDAKIHVLEERQKIQKESQLLQKEERQIQADRNELKQLKSMVSREERLLSKQPQGLSPKAQSELLHTEQRLGKLMSKEQQDLEKLKQTVQQEHSKEAEAEKAVQKWDEVVKHFGVSKNIDKKHEKESKKYQQSQAKAKKLVGKIAEVETESEEVMTMHKSIALKLEELHLTQQQQQQQQSATQQQNATQHQQQHPHMAHPMSAQQQKGPLARHRLGLRAR